MSSVEYLREFVNERLTAAAEEIFRVFNKTIFEYEEEIDRQRKLLDIVLKPEIKLHRTELPQQHVCKEEEVLSAQQLCIQERNSSLDQEDPEPPQIKEEQEELCTSQEGDIETLMWTPTDEESDYSEGQTLDFNPDKSQSVAETELPASLCVSRLKEESECENPEVSEPKSVLCLKHDLIRNPIEKSIIITSIKSSVESEPNSDHQLLSHNCHVAESQDQKGGKHGDSGSTRNAEPKQHTRHHKFISHSDNEYHPTVGEKYFICNTCDKAFKKKSNWQRHLRIHTGEKPYSCKICGKDFGHSSTLLFHIRAAHTGEKPYSCNTCGKKYCRPSDLEIHVRNHTGEKPYSCHTCGKKFTKKSVLTAHIRIHSDEKPFTCKTCGKDFGRNSNLLAHMRRAHTVVKPYSCSTCGKT